MLLISILSFSTASWVAGILLWFVLFKRTLFDPRIYVLYGMVHWLLVGQIGTLLGYQFYEVRPYFDEVTHAKAAITILSAIVFFLLGFHLCLRRKGPSVQQGGLKTNLYSIDAKWLALITLFMGIIGLPALYFFQRNLSLIPKLRFLPLLVTYLVPSAGVCGSYVLVLRGKELKGVAGTILKCALLMIILLSIFSSNVTFVFPLFALLYWSFNREKIRIKPSTIMLQTRPHLRRILRWVLVVALAGVISLISKVGIQKSIAQRELVDLEGTREDLLHRLATLDLFNPESYGIVLHAIEMYADQGNYLLGKSFLVLMPFLRFVWTDVRGFGRIMVLDVYGSSYEAINVGWAIPPIGELIANFSYPSVPFFYFVIGLVCRYLYQQYRRSNNSVYLGFYSVVLPWLFMQQRGDFLNGTVFPAYIVLTVTFVFWLCRSKRMGPGKAELLDRKNFT